MRGKIDLAEEARIRGDAADGAGDHGRDHGPGDHRRRHHEEIGNASLEIDPADPLEQDGVGDQRERRRQQAPEPGDRRLVPDRHDVAMEQAQDQLAIGPYLIEPEALDLPVRHQADGLGVTIGRALLVATLAHSTFAHRDGRPGGLSGVHVHLGGGHGYT